MDGQSLLGLSGAAGDRTSRAFTQFLAPNSSFEPVTRGTLGVIDGQHQFVLDLEKNAGALFDLAEAHDQKVDRSRAEPALAANLRAQIVQEFPEICGRQPDEA
jgi:hypothetical protein